MSNIVNIKPSQLSRGILELKGKPLDLEDYKPFELIYDINPEKATLQCGRQIGKSVSLGALITSNSIIRKHFGTLFTSPLQQQTSRFSTQYLEPFLASPIVKKHYIDSASKRNVFERTLNNGSRITLGYAETEADSDRIRGVSADALYCDEIQDMSLDAIPVLEETLSASDYGYRRFTGTAKGEGNSLNVMFKRSNMCEWVVKCDSCGKYTVPHDFDTCLKILDNPLGPGCVHCGAVLDMKKGMWVAAKPHITDHFGFHIPQLCIPARNKPKKWKELRSKALTYSTVKLANEVFGTATGSGGRPLSLREAMACCNPLRTSFDEGFPSSSDPRGILCTTLGVDWSVTGSAKSYTVVTVLGWDYHGRCYLLYAQRLDGIDILAQVKHVMYLYNKFQCSMIGSDRGVGVLQGQMMKRDLGEDRVSMINYVAAKTQLRWDKDGQFFAADRTMSIDSTILKMKMGSTRFETPHWELMQTFWEDALHIFEEETLAGRRVYRKDEDHTDDWLHSVTFAMVAYMVVKGDFVYLDEASSQDDTFKL